MISIRYSPASICASSVSVGSPFIVGAMVNGIYDHRKDRIDLTVTVPASAKPDLAFVL